MENSGDSRSGSTLPREVSVQPFLIGFLKLSGALLLMISGLLIVCLSLSKLESSLTVSNGPRSKPISKEVKWEKECE